MRKTVFLLILLVVFIVVGKEKKSNDFCVLQVSLHNISNQPFDIIISRDNSKGKISLKGSTPGTFNKYYDYMHDFENKLTKDEVDLLFKKVRDIGFFDLRNDVVTDYRNHKDIQLKMTCRVGGKFNIYYEYEDLKSTPFTNLSKYIQKLASKKIKTSENGYELKKNDYLASALYKYNIQPPKEKDIVFGLHYYCDKRILMMIRFEKRYKGKETIYFSADLENDIFAPPYSVEIDKKDFEEAYKEWKTFLKKSNIKRFEQQPDFIFQPRCELRLLLKNNEENTDVYYYQTKFDRRILIDTGVSKYWNKIGSLIEKIYKEKKGDGSFKLFD